MARRSAMNERYQKNTLPSGKTRKSAAAAKPKRSTGTPSSAKSSKPKTAAKREPLIVNPPTPEFRFWRRIWWALLVVAFVITAASWFIRDKLANPMWGNISLVAGYAAIFMALYIDWTKLRPMRQAWTNGGKEAAEKAAAEKARADKAAAKVAADAGDTDTATGGTDAAESSADDES